MTGSPIRRTKIVATMGPAWEGQSRMRALLDAGIDMVRINASHGTPESRASWIERVQTMRTERQKPTGILVDLHGPRIRVGRLPEPITLEPGQMVRFAPEDSADADDIPTTYPALAGDVKPGSRTCSTTACSRSRSRRSTVTGSKAACSTAACSRPTRG